MTGDFVLHINIPPAVPDPRIADILTLLTAIQTKENKMAVDLTNLTTAVANETSVNQSAITLLGELKSLIVANINDPVALQALVDQMTTDQTALADAVTANTPPTPTPTPAPTPPPVVP